MSKESVAKFYELASRDVGLQRNLAAIGEKYKDEPMEESLKRFIVQTEIIPLAQRAGFNLEIEEVINYLDERAEKIAKEHIRQVSGGHGERNSHFSVGEMTAAKVAKKSIIHSATDSANKFYRQNYKNN